MSQYTACPLRIPMRMASSALALMMLAGCSGTAVVPSADADPQWISLHCGPQSFSVAYADQQAWFREGTRTSRLAQAVSASGARYTGRHDGLAVELWEKGGQVRLDLGGKLLACVHPEQLPWRDLTCGDNTWQVAFAAERAWLRAGDTEAELARTGSDWGARFAGAWQSEAVALWHQGRQVSLQLGDRPEIQCEQSAEYSAQGNEPFWRIEQHGEVFELDRLGSTGPWAGNLVTLSSERGLSRVEVQGVGADALLRLDLEPSLCRDSMSGMPFPDSVRVEFAGEVLQGCGGEPERLLRAKAWQPEGTQGNRRAVLRFEPAGLLALDGHCNLHRGRWQLSGEGLTLEFGPSTLRACDAAIEAEERRLVEALAAIVQHGFDDQGALLLYASDGSVLRLPAASGE